jgi:hypothetical protein
VLHSSRIIIIVYTPVLKHFKSWRDEKNIKKLAANPKTRAHYEYRGING